MNGSILQKMLLTTFNDEAHEVGEGIVQKGHRILEHRRHKQEKFNNALEWDSVGLRLWQNFNKRR